MRILNLILFTVFTMSMSCCDKEKECNPLCGPLQSCNDGVCSCKTDQFLLGTDCVTKCFDCFEGSFDCGCTDKFIIDATKFESSSVTVNYVTPGILGYHNASTSVTKLGESKYRFLINRSCDVGDRKSTNIEFIVDKSDATQLTVDARFHILPSNETLATCSSVFTR
jgi:hypothetical protein